MLGDAITKRMNAKGLSARALILTIGFCTACGPAFSQSGPALPSRAVFYSKIEPLADTIARVGNDPRPATTGNALRALDWLIYANVTVGGAYDSNVYAAPTQQSVYGSRFSLMSLLRGTPASSARSSMDR